MVRLKLETERILLHSCDLSYCLLLKTVDMGGCGGSLIAPGVVLSAAHCGSHFGRRVSVGAYERYELTGGATRVRVVDEARHPNYNAATVDNDFLLLRLEEPVEMNTDVVLSINDQFSRPSIGQSLTVLGLGMTSQGGPIPDFLRDVVVQAISIDRCNSGNRYDDEVRDSTMFCAGKTTP
jgi:secreted trypsin-like serine protease